MTRRRVFHPTLPVWRDVDASTAEEWKAAGWRLTRPDGFDADADAPPPTVEPRVAPPARHAADPD